MTVAGMHRNVAQTLQRPKYALKRTTIGRFQVETYGKNPAIGVKNI